VGGVAGRRGPPVRGACSHVYRSRADHRGGQCDCGMEILPRSSGDRRRSSMTPACGRVVDARMPRIRC
jgi:hypothetical protein